MTSIEWTEKTWNPIIGCSIVSPGCTNCYAMRMAARLEAMAGPGLDDEGYAVRSDPNATDAGAHYRGTTKRVNGKPVWTGELRLAPDHILTAPLHRHKPTTYFVNSMGDLFHESVPDEWIDKVFAIMAMCEQHTFQVLTKRSARMRYYMSRADDEHGDFFERLSDAATALSDSPCAAHVEDINWPPVNVWLGVSAERQQEADARIPDLMGTAAAVRFISAEPLLGPISIRTNVERALFSGSIVSHGDGRRPIDWVIVGGESGPDARPMHPDWARSLRDQCQAAGVPFFFKQWGAWTDGSAPGASRSSERRVVFTDGATCAWTGIACEEEERRAGSWSDRRPVLMTCIGKGKSGRLLDGREWNEMPRHRQSGEAA